MARAGDELRAIAPGIGGSEVFRRAGPRGRGDLLRRRQGRSVGRGLRPSHRSQCSHQVNRNDRERPGQEHHRRRDDGDRPPLTVKPHPPSCLIVTVAARLTFAGKSHSTRGTTTGSA